MKSSSPIKRLLRLLTRPALATGIVALAFTLGLYGDTMRLPLFSDDLLQIPWLTSISWRQLWSSPSPYGYYRPLWYSLWRVWGALVGGLHPPGLHALNLAAHFVAAWLTGLLTAAWIRPRSRAIDALPSIVATALFAAFPFARQAVAWPGAVYNPLVSAMAAGALLAYDRGRREGGARWALLALLLALMAPLTYEVGLLLGVLVALVEGIGQLTARWPRRETAASGWWALAFLGVLPLTLALWRQQRGAGVVGFGLTPLDLWRNIGYLVQGLIYPTAPLGQRLSAVLGVSAEAGLWVVALPTLALLAWAGLRRHRGGFALGALWFALFALPPIVTMEAAWFALAPRYLYVTAAGAALMWAAAIDGVIARLRPARRSPTRWSAAVGLLLVAMLLPAGRFVREGVRLYARAGESIWDAAEAARAGRRPILLINLPNRITPHTRRYPLGFEGVTPLPQRVDAEGLVYVHTGLHAAAEALSFGVVATDQPENYAYWAFGPEVGWQELADAVRRSGDVYLTRYDPTRIRLLEAGGPGPRPATGGPPLRFGEQIALLKAVARCDDAGSVRLTIHWQVEERVETDATVFAHLLQPDGAVLTQADGHPLLQMMPFWLWEAGEVMRDVRHFDPAPAGTYTIRLGVWDLSSGEIWPAEGGEESDGLVYLPVRCP